MCLVAILHRAVDGAPIVIAANREEYYARGGEPPQIETGDCSYLAGKDPDSGGTWLGVNQHGLLVAVTNRAKLDLPANARSRGLLARDLLHCPSAKLALQLAITELEKGIYAGCNFLLADFDQVLVIHCGDLMEVRPLPVGAHVLSWGNVNDEADERLNYSLHWLANVRLSTLPHAMASLRDLCSQTGNGSPPICLKGKDRGTVSSSLIALAVDTKRSEYWHAAGCPDATAHDDYSHLLRELLNTT